MRKIDKLADDATSYEDESDQFFNERLLKHSRDEWPSRIDRAAFDILYGVAIGRAKSKNDFGGTIGRHDFGKATGKYYKKGLTELSNHQSDLPRLIEQYQQEYGDESLGDLVFRLNELRHELEKNLNSPPDINGSGTQTSASDIQNLDRAVEAVIDKMATSSLSEDVTRQSLQRPESVTDAMIQLFSDPAISEYAAALTESVKEVSETESFLERLDAPYMTTPLWDHQREALETWLQNDCKGYVDMATATGKTVLGLAALALFYGKLHPQDMAQIEPDMQSRKGSPVRVLVVAGQDLILEQWQSELDEHLNIPRERTQTDGRAMKFTWGTIEFRTAQGLLGSELLDSYDLAILDEAHQYSSGSRTGGFRSVLEQLIDECTAFLAMSGSIDTSWQGDSTVRRILEENLHECKRFTVDEAREAGVVADFEWDIYYAHSVSGDSQDGLVESTKPIKKVYDVANHKIRVDELEGPLPSNTPSEFETLTDLRSFSQSKQGASARDQSPPFDELATSAFTRRPKRWQLSPSDETLISLIDKYAPERQCVVLVQSYDQAEALGEKVAANYGDDIVLIPNSSATEQFNEISSFKEKDRGVIIGPANVLGMGVDLPHAEVAINISKGGVNAQLIQRIGRVLRNPHGDKEAKFYQIVTLPSDPRGLLPGEDGRRLLRRASEFRALGARLRQLPGYDVADNDTAQTLATLERNGANAVTEDHRSINDIVEDEVAQAFLGELRDKIAKGERRTGGLTSPVLINFNGAAIARDSRPVAEAVTTHKKNPTTEPTSRETSYIESSESTTEDSVGNLSESPISIELSPPLQQLITYELNSGSYNSLDELVDDYVGTHVSDRINGDEEATVVPDTEFTVTLPPQFEALVERKLSNDDDDVDTFLKKALYNELDLNSDSISLSVNLNSGLRQVVKTIVATSDSYETIANVVEEALYVQLTND